MRDSNDVLVNTYGFCGREVNNVLCDLAAVESCDKICSLNESVTGEVKELYSEAISAFRRYSGLPSIDEEEVDD